MGDFKSLKVYPETKEVLDNLKIISRESYDSVIKRVINTSSLFKGGTF